MSKQVNCVNIEPEIVHGNWSPSWKYNEVLVNPSSSCKTDIIISNNTLGHTYTMQELVKEVNHGLALLHGFKLSPQEVY